MDIGVFSASEWLYTDTSPDQGSSNTLELAVARGAHTACQLLIIPEATDAKMTISVEQIAGPALPPAEVFELRDVMVEKNTGWHGFVAKDGDDPSGYVTRLAPFRVYDAMRPATDGNVQTNNGRAAVYLCWRLPVSAEPGRVQAVIRVSAREQTVAIPVAIEVSSAVVPEQGRLRVTNWFSLDNMATRHELTPWSEEHWDMIAAYGKLMRRGRQTNFWVPSSLHEIKRTADGCVQIDFSRAKRLIELFLDLGFTCIEGGHVGGRLRFGDPDFVLNVDRDIKATGPEGYAFLAQYLPAWHGFLQDNGWLDQTIQYVGDEPIDASAQDYRVLAGIVRKFMPGIPLIDAVERPGLGGAVDIWVPKNSYFQEHREEFETHRRFGDTLWFYTCCIPGGKYMNRLLDMPLLRTRYLHWGNYKYDLKGYLHWGLNHYKAGQNPFEENAPAHGEGGTTNLPPGDTHIVYPGTDGPWGSVRLQAMAMGIEDYELFQQLDPETGRAICQRCLPAFDQPNEDLQAFDRAHEDLLITASRG